jgi:hypothetical protein
MAAVILRVRARVCVHVFVLLRQWREEGRGKREEGKGKRERGEGQK